MLPYYLPARRIHEVLSYHVIIKSNVDRPKLDRDVGSLKSCRTVLSNPMVDRSKLDRVAWFKRAVANHPYKNSLAKESLFIP